MNGFDRSIMPKLTQKKKELPKGLQEFQASLWEMEFSEELLKRLLDLPEQGLHSEIEKHRAAMIAARKAEEDAVKARRQAAVIADGIFRFVLENWTVKQIQKATGYDNK